MFGLLKAFTGSRVGESEAIQLPNVADAQKGYSTLSRDENGLPPGRAKPKQGRWFLFVAFVALIAILGLMSKFARDGAAIRQTLTDYVAQPTGSRASTFPDTTVHAVDEVHDAASARHSDAVSQDHVTGDSADASDVDGSDSGSGVDHEGSEQKKQAGHPYIGSYFHSPPRTEEVGFDFPVDIVYTWSGDPSAEDLAQSVQECPNDHGGVQRFRDLGVIPVSIDLSLHHLPWARYVHVIVPRNQNVDCWSNTERYGKLRFVVVDDLYLPEDHDILPPRNSRTLEANLHRVPGLSEHFVYIQDDQVFLKPVKKSDIFTQAGDPKQICSQSVVNKIVAHASEHWPTLPHDPAWILILSHAPLIYRKSWWDELYKIWPKEMNHNRRAKCRSDCPVSSTQLLNYYAIYKGNSRSASQLKSAFSWNLPYHGAAQSDFDKLRQIDADVITLNDDYERVDQNKLREQMKSLHMFLRGASYDIDNYCF